MIIYTEYFGGLGEQFACVFKGEINQQKSMMTINEVLKMLGVEPECDLNEFDTVGLSNYRSQPEYLDKYSDLVDALDY